MRVLATLFAVALISCTASTPVVQPTPTQTREPNTLSVSVLLDLSGPRSPSGQPQRNAMQVWLDQTQASTPAVKLRVRFVDVAGSDSRVLLELRHAAIDDRADAIVVGVPATVDDTFAQAVQVAGVPVLLTLPEVEPTTTPGGRWMFALAPTPDTIARALVTDVIARGVRAPSLIASDESPAAVVERTLYASEIGRHGFAAPAPIITTQNDAASAMKTGAAVAKSVIFAGASAPYGDLIRAIPVSVDAPRVYLSYLTETADVTNLRDESGLVTWPGSRYLATISVPPLPGPRAVFVQAFTDRHGAPSTLAATAYDALSIIDAAAELAPSELDAAHLRLRLETLTFAGVVTRYSFSPAQHAGFQTGDLAFLRWNAQRGAPFVAADPNGDAR